MTFIFIFLVLLAEILVILLGASGGQYVYGSNMLAYIGLDFLIIDTISPPTSNLWNSWYEAIFYSWPMTIILTLIFISLIYLLVRETKVNDIVIDSKVNLEGV